MGNNGPDDENDTCHLLWASSYAQHFPLIISFVFTGEYSYYLHFRGEGTEVPESVKGFAEVTQLGVTGVGPEPTSSTGAVPSGGDLALLFCFLVNLYSSFPPDPGLAVLPSCAHLSCTFCPTCAPRADKTPILGDLFIVT